MKKIHKIIFSIVFLFVFSCENYIDIVPDNVATFDLVFNNRTNAKKFFFTLYGYLPGFADYNDNVALVGGDEIWTHQTWTAMTFSQGEQSKASPLFDHWGDGNRITPHIALRDCNIFLNRINDVPDMTQAEKDRWIAEAKFLKAYFHFHLLRMYGPIPIIDENIEVSEDIISVRIGRDTVDEVVDYVVSLLDESIAGLPSQIFLEGDELGRATQPIAAMLKAKVLALSASPQFNGNSVYASWTDDEGTPYINQTYDENKWQLAADACKEAIDYAHAGGHSLFTFTSSYDLADETLYKMNLRGAITDRWNDEIIWGQAYNPTTSNIQNVSFPRIDPAWVGQTAGQVNSYYSAPLHIAEQFYSINGVPIDEDTTYDYNARYDITPGDEANKFYVKEGYETIGLHLNREPRFYASLAADGVLSYDVNNEADDTSLFHVDAKNGGVSGYINERQYNQTGYWPKKLVHYKSFIANDSYTAENYSWPVYRLADLYLLYAECLNEAQGPSTEVYQYLDEVRERSGLDGVVNSWASYSSNPSKPTTKDGLRDIIHDERLIELAFEGHRFWDLRRWYKAHLVLNSTPMEGWSFSRATPETYYTIDNYGFTEFSIRDYFWPISEADILANPNLDQAFGW
ncbi:RagB/SusD family nutrient uptake outer membrane protein [Tamlana sp. 62-3]|uniref:RagB/SusD family nutrient uptake outer membrane protein n=1 Tax=Neotamlana sargassicola TaxID=2883125 RepID=A0A9X1I4Z6_9FLAO|nr:RagB/SusD family nutrient uptake outer membrane protein [Tamlana sargassicola]MCB4807956.1 RagB/SusD family nutrient uptake outer membrane protein [Tamlana sargassicola]